MRFDDLEMLHGMGKTVGLLQCFDDLLQTLDFGLFGGHYIAWMKTCISRQLLFNPVRGRWRDDRYHAGRTRRSS